MYQPPFPPKRQVFTALLCLKLLYINITIVVLPFIIRKDGMFFVSAFQTQRFDRTLPQHVARGKVHHMARIHRIGYVHFIRYGGYDHGRAAQFSIDSRRWAY